MAKHPTVAQKYNSKKQVGGGGGEIQTYYDFFFQWGGGGGHVMHEVDYLSPPSPPVALSFHTSTGTEGVLSSFTNNGYFM